MQKKKKRKKNNVVDVHTWKCHLTVLKKSVYIDQGSKKKYGFSSINTNSSSK